VQVGPVEPKPGIATAPLPTSTTACANSSASRSKAAARNRALVGWATDQLKLTVQIVAKLTGQTTFVVLHRRWAVERTFS
jgi:hypothetical protein